MEILKQYLSQNFFNDGAITTCNLSLEEACARFQIYYDLLIEWNNKFNLTAITESVDVQNKHFVDSLLGEQFVPPNSSICDIGSGAGFPAVPLAILRPDCTFTLVDSLSKRVTFLTTLISALNLSNCTAVHARAEDFARTNFESYDICLARALAPLPTLLEYTLPLIHRGGTLLAYKGSSATAEVDASARALQILGADAPMLHSFSLPNSDPRIIITIAKARRTPPIYPRIGNKPRTNPL